MSFNVFKTVCHFRGAFGAVEHKIQHTKRKCPRPSRSSRNINPLPRQKLPALFKDLQNQGRGQGQKVAGNRRNNSNSKKASIFMNGPSETTKTSLLIIASIFTATGGALLPTDGVKGSILLLLGVAVLVIRGYLKQKGIENS